MQQRLSPVPFFGIGLLTCLGFLYGGSLIFMPWWAVIILYVIWVPLYVIAWRRFSKAPRSVLPLAAIGVACWLLAVVAAILDT